MLSSVQEIEEDNLDSFSEDEDEEDAVSPPIEKDKSANIILDEIYQFCQLVGPVALTCLLEYLPSLASIALVGRYCDRNDLDGAALGTMYFNVAALSVSIGFTSAADTLCPTAVGSGKEKLLGTYLQRGVGILTVLMIPLLVCGVNAAAILEGLGQPHLTSRRGGSYVLWMLPSLPSFLGFELLRKVLHAFSVVEPLVFIGVMSTLVHIVLAYLFVTGTISLPFQEPFHGTGYVGAALARSLSMAFALVVLIIYAFCIPTRRGGMSQEDGVSERSLDHSKKKRPLSYRFWDGIQPFSIVFAKKDVIEYLRLGGAGCAAICFEWWAFEIVALFCGLLPKRPDVFIGAHAILFSLGALFYMVLSGCASAATVRCGLALGANQPRRASLACGVALAAGLCCGLSNATIIFFTRKDLPALFAKDPAIRKVATASMPVLALYQVFDAWNAVSAGVLNGAGRQTTPALISFLSYYVFGIPSSLLLAFVAKWKLTGLWLGLTFGLMCACIGYNIATINLDWSILAEEAVERVNEENNHDRTLPPEPGYLRLAASADDDRISLSSSGGLSLKETPDHRQEQLEEGAGALIG